MAVQMSDCLSNEDSLDPINYSSTKYKRNTGVRYNSNCYYRRTTQGL